MKPTVFNSEQLQTLRKAAGLTQDEMVQRLNARKIDVTLRTLVYWESGEYHPDADVLAAIADIIGVPIQSFYQ